MKPIILFMTLALLFVTPATAEVLEIPATAVHLLQSPADSSETRAMVRFDLSSVHSKVLTAYMDWDLEFEAAQEADQPEGIEVKYRVLRERWDETDGTWAELDAFAHERTKEDWGSSVGTKETVRLLMTNVVQSWLKLPRTNFGLVVELDEGIHDFDAKRVGGEIKKPILRIWTSLPAQDEQLH